VSGHLQPSTCAGSQSHVEKREWPPSAVQLWSTFDDKPASFIETACRFVLLIDIDRKFTTKRLSVLAASPERWAGLLLFNLQPNLGLNLCFDFGLKFQDGGA
jgi:hypothetical protein